MNNPVKVGVISDTHGLLRPAALDALAGVELILHAGDIGRPEVLDGLRTIAPFVAVRGNNDRAAWAESLPWRATLEVAGVKIHLLHIQSELDLDPASAGIRVVVSGHSHRPRQEWRVGVLHLNPGSAGPRRFGLPVAVARLYISPAEIRAEIIELAV